MEWVAGPDSSRRTVSRNGEGEPGCTGTDDPWSALPRSLAAMFRPRAGDVAAAILHEIQRSIPEYARPLEGRFGEAITEGIEQAINQFIERMADPDASKEEAAKLFRWLGKLEVSEGRGVDTLQTAYHVGARVAWRLIAEFGQAAQLSSATICQLADALFVYIDEISALSVEGYAAAKVRNAGALERRRRRLLELILSDPPVSTEALGELAGPARWELPEHIAAVALERRDELAEPAALALDDGVLADLGDSEPYLIVADPDRRRSELESELACRSGWRAVVGPKVRLSEANISLRWARRALELARRGVLADQQLIWCGEHLPTLLLTTDEFLVRELARSCLAPLDPLTVKQRTRLSETLLALLETRGSAPEIATRLHIHPQTVRYRLHQLEDLFGDRLRDPDERFALEISLRALQLLS
ncbi:helix-turn-helix domain-containing protein [Amycolatopsis aidingensis]|uniref:PucR family transcriptional regulator n=1 Tax=Amycolatopsis aidingensis TaxID=2842453 RepID=UPI001E28DD0D|nr:PucR family transcriptional regulator [Amycolatopsis aidingensis]